MTLASGKKLGSYEIAAPLGAGGMGEVYRAKDAKLGREAAIKILPEALASDPDRRLRFEQEARSASALNHPNILTIYDIGEADGSLYIAMELVEGKTLRELLASGEPLPTRKLLDVAVQTAEGLAKAHDAGIVHRDLKPENLMVSKDGYVKILDFGLAKLTEPVSQGQSIAPTAIAAPTEPGTVMGTAGYMSPEQASGQSVDYRSDQFTLGAIVYEMATGKKAFQRKTGAETLVAIIREEPEPLGQLAPKAPAPVRWIVERLLAKDPEERYASTRDLARDLKSLRDHLTETSVSGALQPAEPVKPRRRGWPLLAAAALLLGVGLGLLARSALGGKPAPPTQFERLTYQSGTIQGARFAPDGQTIVYGAAWDGAPLEVFSTRPGSAEFRLLGLPGAAVLAVSSEGEIAVSLHRHYLLGYQATGTLARVTLAGGAPREILEGVQDADWSPDGKQLAVSRVVGNQSRLEYPVGKVLFQSSGWVGALRVSPDGRHLAFFDHSQRGNNDGNLVILDSTGKERARGPFVKAAMALAWSPSGDEVWYGGISAMSLEGRVRQVWTSTRAAITDIAKDGRVLFAEATGRRELLGFPASDAAPRNLTVLNWSFPTDVSRETVLLNEQQVDPPAIYVRKLDGSPAVRIGDGAAYGLSPDGKWALATKLPDRRPIILIPTGPGEPKTLDIGDLTCMWGNFFPDGKRILILGNEPGRAPRLYVQALGGAGAAASKPRPITPEGVTIAAQALSPDGQSIVARGPDGQIAIYPVEPGQPRPVPGLQPEDLPIRFTPDGRSLFVNRLSSPPGIIEIVDIATGRRTTWKEFVPPDPAGVELVGPAMIAQDAKSYVYSYRRELDELYLARGLR
jgi:Tol biopolymer transport system component/predicted Ser/Thr protein kinase